MARPLSPREWWSLTFIACAVLIAFCLIYLAAPARAQETGYTSDDTLAAIWQYAIEYDVSYVWLRRVVQCKAPGFDPYAVGRAGELGAAQLHPHGLLPKFYALGYDDPFSPYQAVRFMAQEFAYGRSGAWSCR